MLSATDRNLVDEYPHWLWAHYPIKEDNVVALARFFTVVQNPPPSANGQQNYPQPTDEPGAQVMKTSERYSDQSINAVSMVDRVTSVDLMRVSVPAVPPSPITMLMLVAIALMVVGLSINSFWLGIAGATVALILAVRVFWGGIRNILSSLMTQGQRQVVAAVIGVVFALICIVRFTGFDFGLAVLSQDLNWDAIGASGEVFGAVGQILIAVLAVWIAYRQYVIERDLTTQQNLITQQQTIDSYFQGISDLVLDAEGLLEDWPQERAIAEGRTAALLSSVDAGGKAKVLRFLSRSRLLSPLKRDSRLGRAILDGVGGYVEDRDYGVRVIDLGVMLAGANLMRTDLRWIDLSDTNLIRANLQTCDLVKINFSRTILAEADLRNSDMMGARLFYGSAETATPRSKMDVPNYVTGEHTGAVIEEADFSDVHRLSEEQRYYCCAWGGSKTRSTVPGGCEGIPNKLGR